MLGAYVDFELLYMTLYPGLSKILIIFLPITHLSCLSLRLTFSISYGVEQLGVGRKS